MKEKFALNYERNLERNTITKLCCEFSSLIAGFYLLLLMLRNCFEPLIVAKTHIIKSLSFEYIFSLINISFNEVDRVLLHQKVTIAFVTTQLIVSFWKLKIIALEMM